MFVGGTSSACIYHLMTRSEDSSSDSKDAPSDINDSAATATAASASAPINHEQPQQQQLLLLTASMDSHEPQSQSQAQEQAQQAQFMDEYQSTLRASKLAIKHAVVCCLFNSMSHSLRTIIWIIYAREFSDSSHNLISLVIFSAKLNLFLTGILMPVVSDWIGHDCMLCFILFVYCCGLFGECIAPDFATLAVSYILSELVLFPIISAYITWILPKTEAILALRNAYALYGICTLIGPMLSGVIATYLSVRGVFWLSWLMSLLMVAYSLLFVRASQALLETKQKALLPHFELQLLMRTSN